MKFKTGENPSSQPPQGGADDVLVNPIPRLLPQQCITLNFTMRTWEEIGPGKLYYLPICQNPVYMMDKVMLNQFNTYSNLWSTMEIHTPTVRMSNLIMLQDDLRVQNNTPTDATAFTQVVYLLHFTPKNQTMFFSLQSLQDDELYTGPNLAYRLQPTEPNVSRLVELQNFDNFERLLINPANPKQSAGYIIGEGVDSSPIDFRIFNPYVNPSMERENFHKMAGNSQTKTNDDATIEKTYFINNGEQLLFARNLDTIQFHKYGDTIDIPIVTNLEGKHLMPTKINDFTEPQTVTLDVGGGKKETYALEWCWPGRNRPYYSRETNLDTAVAPHQMAKQFAPLNHHFFCMPPIKKPNGALLGQRCSLLLEQSFSVTLHFPTSVFAGESEEMGTLAANDVMAQNSGIILRRNFYGKPGVKAPSQGSPFCGQYKKPANCGGFCPQNTWDSWVNWMVTNVTGSDFDETYLISDDPNLLPEEQITRISVDKIDTEDWLGNQALQAAWIKCLDNPETYAILVTVSEGKQVVVDNVRYWQVGEMGNDTNVNYYRTPFVGGSMEAFKYVYINARKFISIRNNFMQCLVPTVYTESKSKRFTPYKNKKRIRQQEQADEPLVFNKFASTFFC